MQNLLLKRYTQKKVKNHSYKFTKRNTNSIKINKGNLVQTVTPHGKLFLQKKWEIHPGYALELL